LKEEKRLAREKRRELYAEVAKRLEIWKQQEAKRNKEDVEDLKNKKKEETNYHGSIFFRVFFGFRRR